MTPHERHEQRVRLLIVAISAFFIGVSLEYVGLAVSHKLCEPDARCVQVDAPDVVVVSNGD